MLAQDSSAPPNGAGMPISAPLDGNGLPLLAAADLQDHLMVAQNDLERLQRLLSDACDQLMGHFYGASGELRTMLHEAVSEDGHHPQLHKAMEHMAGAITAMQFQDMASQLVAHTSRRLRNCADRLAAQAMGDEDEDGSAIVEEMPLRPNPVTQDEMDAGSVELF
jgi:hypothetical protein